VLKAMAPDAGAPARVADLAARLKKPGSWINNYRSRLLAAEGIGPSDRGRVRYTIPYLGECLANEATARTP
jgi:hypothetical protein